nr:hypothetical protein [uncultured bacterium]
MPQSRSRDPFFGDRNPVPKRLTIQILQPVPFKDRKKVNLPPFKKVLNYVSAWNPQP